MKKPTALTNVPIPVKVFLQRALIIFVVWKLLYHLILLPQRFPDRQITALTATSTSVLYKALFDQATNVESLGSTKSAARTILYINGTKTIRIADSCNGLELYVLYAGFLLCFSTSAKRLWAFMLLGLLGIFILNSFRCVGLAWLFLHNYSMADFAHHYLFKMVIYGAIFYAWVLYTKKISWNAH